MGVFDTRPLDGDERRFWRRWVTQLLITGALIGVIYQLVPVAIATVGITPFGVGPYGTAFTPHVVGVPILMLVALGLGFAQWQALRSLLPTLRPWWIALTLLGPLIALTVMTTDGSYSRFTDLFSMASFFYSNILGRSQSAYASLSLLILLPITTFAGIAAALQAFALKGAINAAGWWVGVAMAAAVVGLGAARLVAPLRVAGVWPRSSGLAIDLFLLDTGVVMIQLGAACAAYGIVSGLGLIALRRIQQTRPRTLALA